MRFGVVTLFLLFAIAGLGLGGCGVYTTSGVNASSVGDIYIPIFTDETQGSRAPDVATRLTDRFVDEFDRHRSISVFQGANERTRAQKELIGRVRSVREAVLTRNENDTGEEYTVVVSAAFQYGDIQSGETLWEDSSVTGDGNYLLEDGENGFQGAVDEALDEILDKVLDKTIRAW